MREGDQQRDTFPHAITISDQNHRISLGNPTVARIFGHAPEELVGKIPIFCSQALTTANACAVSD